MIWTYDHMGIAAPKEAGVMRVANDQGVSVDVVDMARVSDAMRSEVAAHGQKVTQ